MQAFLEGSLGLRNISFVGNSFTAVRGCGGQRGQQPCYHVCSNMSCVLSHVDPDLLPEVQSQGNKVRDT